ncbi:helix-turn-helix domain-containing protein [Citrifermentans bremense]|uniref:helix-turn-helix domain-containing protein n=1 Tax=Citrifermentans bremense TaxID=60035 RepID=UPI0003FE300B|nr:helix-turn-helix transcriptional regulator [Citrifermentans bremense]
MNDSEALVELALRTLSCKQKELALRLGVSPAQISKWKKGEYMSYDMEKKLRDITNIGDRDPELVLRSDSLEDVDKWENLIRYIADSAMDNAETGYRTDPLLDEEGFLCEQTFSVLREMGVELPRKFPKDIDYDGDDIEDICEILFKENPYSSLIYEIYTSLNDVYGFYVAYLSSTLFEDALLEEGIGEEIEPNLIRLAASKIEDGKGLTSNFDSFKYKVTKEYEEWLNKVKEAAFKAGIPLKAELLELVYDDHDHLGCEAEAESFGFRSSQIHPDIYMNELLQGMRAIHQILPFIMKKLGIYDEFKLDRADLTARGPSSPASRAEESRENENEDEGDS